MSFREVHYNVLLAQDNKLLLFLLSVGIISGVQKILITKMGFKLLRF